MACDLFAILGIRLVRNTETLKFRIIAKSLTRVSRLNVLANVVNVTNRGFLAAIEFALDVGKIELLIAYDFVINVEDCVCFFHR